MLVTFATLGLLALFLGVLVFGVLLLRRTGWARLLGIVLVVEALLALTAQIALSTLPFGIGEPLIRVGFREIALQALATIGIALAVGTALVALVRWSQHTTLRGARRATVVTAALLLVPVVGALGLYGLAQASLPERERERDPAKREITLNPGFAWSVYAQGTIDNPTVITFGPDGKLYIGDISGTLWVASDDNGDKQIDRMTPWATGFQLLVGLVWRDGELYTASAGKVEAWRDADGDGKADTHRTVVENLPSMILQPHSNNSLAFGPDGRLYFGVGSTTSGDYEPNKLAASVLSVKPDGSDLKVFAHGFGNTFGVAFNSAGDLFGGDNSPGAGNENPDEFNHIVEGGNYGYPYVFGDPEKKLGTIGALATFPAHATPTGMSFYSGTTFPASYRDNGFVALWQRGEIVRVELAKTSSGDYLSRMSTFGAGFLYPIDAISGPDGDLYVADFGTSAIYRISYVGGEAK